MTMKKHDLFIKTICAGILILTPVSISAKNLTPEHLRKDAPNVYIVKRGDTLWDISKKYLKNPVHWPEIWARNKHIKNPHWIFPGDRLLICSYNGRTIIGKDEGDGCEGIITRYSGDTKLHPQIRVESLHSTIPVIPLDHIKHWLERAIVVSPDALANTPYILGTGDQRVLAAKGQKVYARGNGLELGQRYAVYREGEPYKFVNSNGQQINVGVELIQVASAIAVKGKNDITTLELTDSYNAEVRRGDPVLPEYDPMLPSLFYPTHAENVTAGGQVVRVMGSIGTAARHSVVTIDRGSLDGIQSGQVFTVNQKGEVVRDTKANQNIELPDERIGQVMVFKPFDHLSYAYVLESELPIKIGDNIKNSIE